MVRVGPNGSVWLRSALLCVRARVSVCDPVSSACCGPGAPLSPLTNISLMTGFVLCCAMYMDRSSLTRGESARALRLFFFFLQPNHACFSESLRVRERAPLLPQRAPLSAFNFWEKNKIADAVGGGGVV